MTEVSANAAFLRRRSWWAAAGIVAATYFYFLLFAEFALLALAGRAVQGGEAMRVLLAALGAGGVTGAAGAAWIFRPDRARVLLTVFLAACAGAALLALGAADIVALGVACGLAGLALGALTVVLAGTLGRATAGSRLGLCIGLGTGAAYALCNLPVVFTADARVQTLLAAAGTLAALGAVRGLNLAEVTPAPATRRGTARWTLALLALVWLDSAAFYIIQHTESLKGATWAGAAVLTANAAAHLLAALLAGWLIDAGFRRVPVFAAASLLAAAALVLDGTLPGALPAHWLYTAGVSLYSVALVYFPAASGRAGVAAVVFGVAGWIGSALGIGMAQDLHAVPAWFAGLALVAVIAALIGRKAAPAFAIAVLAGGLVNEAAAADGFTERGREVYIHEGCQHCHSQFVRPGVAADVERWGPATALGRLLEGAPPLPGNRRQGPDLANVGNRRSAEWNRLHLRAPREVSPGSRMPSYAHLFDGSDESDGEALIAYLASLGADTLPERLTQAQAWRPAGGEPIDTGAARRLFAQLCSACHGPEGRGDGVLAARLSLRPPDWPGGGARRALGGPAKEREAELARLIKFGVPGTPMAGHEYLSDAEIVGLAGVVRLWQKAGPEAHEDPRGGR